MSQMLNFGFWPFAVSGLCGVLLLAIIGALIFNPDFRKDMSATEGKANLLNSISVEGAVVLGLCALFFCGLFYPVAYPQQNFKKLAGEYSIEVNQVSDAFELIIQLRKNLVEKELELKRVQDDSKVIKINEIPGFIKNLSPSNPISEEIYNLPSKELGPWSKFLESQLISVSVPGHEIPSGSALSCQEYYGGRYDLFSETQVGGRRVSGEAVTVNANGYIYRSSDCHNKVSYQLQISCSDAVRIFTRAVLSCDKYGQAKWVNQRPEKLLVNLVASTSNSDTVMQESGEKERSVIAKWFK